MATCINLLNVWSVVLVKVHAMRGICDMIVVCSTLAEIVVAPGHSISKTSEYKGMVAPT